MSMGKGSVFVSYHVKADKPSRILDRSDAIVAVREVLDPEAVKAAIHEGLREAEQEARFEEVGRFMDAMAGHLAEKARGEALEACRFTSRLAGLVAECDAEYRDRASKIAEAARAEAGDQVKQSLEGGWTCDEAAVLQAVDRFLSKAEKWTSHPGALRLKAGGGFQPTSAEDVRKWRQEQGIGPDKAATEAPLTGAQEVS